MDQWDVVRILSLYSVYIGMVFLLLGIFIIVSPFIFKFRRKWVRMVFLFGGGLFSLFVIIIVYGIHTGTEIDRNFFQSYDDAEGSVSSDYKFILLSPDSAGVSLSDYFGRVILLNYWATWCAPCIREMPALSQLAENYRDDLAVICISDEESGRVLNWLDDFQPLSQYIGVIRDRSDIPEEHSIFFRVRPVTFFIDKEGNLRDYVVGAKEYEEFEEIILEYL